MAWFWHLYFKINQMVANVKNSTSQGLGDLWIALLIAAYIFVLPITPRIWQTFSDWTPIQAYASNWKSYNLIKPFSNY